MFTRVVFMGSPEFALPTLRALSQNCEVVGVVTQPDRASGRGRELKPPVVKGLALDLGLPIMQPEKLQAPDAFYQLREWKPDLIVVAAFGQILKQEVLDLPAYGCLNIHASLLPRWRGAAPIQAAILAGDQQTGVTIMKMDAGLDSGPILSRKSIPLAAEDTAGSVIHALSVLGAELLLATLPDYLAGKLTPIPQTKADATYAGILKKTDAKLDFTCDVHHLERKVRAFHPWPGAYMDFDGMPLKIHRAHIETGTVEAGRKMVHGELPAIAAEGGILVLDEVQPAGRKTMSGRAFLSGMRNWET